MRGASACRNTSDGPAGCRRAARLPGHRMYPGRGCPLMDVPLAVEHPAIVPDLLRPVVGQEDDDVSRVSPSSSSLAKSGRDCRRCC